MCENVEEYGISITEDNNPQTVIHVRIQPPEPLVIPVEKPKKAWQLWRQRFKFFATATHLHTKPSAVQVATLMSIVGVDAQDIYNSFEFTEEQTLESVLKKFDEYFDPKANLISERYLFNSMKQEENESFSDYLTRITDQGKICEYESVIDDIIRDKIVAGIRDDGMRRYLLTDPMLTLSNAIFECEIYEKLNAEKQNLPTNPTSASVDVNRETEKQNLPTNTTLTSVTASREMEICENCREILICKNCESVILKLSQITKDERSQSTLDVNSVTENVEHETSMSSSKDHEYSLGQADQKLRPVEELVRQSDEQKEKLTENDLEKEISNELVDSDSSEPPMQATEDSLQTDEDTTNENNSSDDVPVDKTVTPLESYSRPDEAAFTFKVSKFSRLEKDVYSSRFMMGNIPWKILIQKECESNGKIDLGFYVECDIESSSLWSCYATLEYTLVSQLEDVSNMIRELEHTFSPEADNWGYSPFLAWEDVLDPKKGFIKDDTVIFQVRVIPDPPIFGAC